MSINCGNLKTTDNPEYPFKGQIATKVIRGKFGLRKVNKRSADAPDFDIVEHVDGIVTQIGSAWGKTTNNGVPFYSMTFDEPSMDKPLHVAAFQNDNNASEYDLMWNRPKQSRQSSDEASQA